MKTLLPISIVAVSASLVIAGGDYGIWTDTQGDAKVRRTDAGNNAVLPMGYEPLDMLEARLQGWIPALPASDPYTGTISNDDAQIFRLQIVLDGLVAPPGPIALDGSPYQPYRYGDRPLFGYFDIDIDDRKDSGGELMPLAQNRYLANVGRLGESPYGSISDRIIREPDDLDADFYSAPYFERSGAEFTLAMCGCFTPTIVSQNGDMDSVFDAGETWIVSGRFLERMIAFQPESALFGGSDFGLFDPVVDLRFEHDIAEDQTTVTLVFPITNTGAAQLAGEPVQALDLSLLNHTSIEEAIDDLIDGADFASGPLRVLVDDWEGEDTDDFRRARDWSLRAIVGTAPVSPDPSALFVWTDTGFYEIPGDLNNDDAYNGLDEQVLSDTIILLDGTAQDADGKLNGVVTIPDFASRFYLADLNGDGKIDEDDSLIDPCPADLSGDGLLNFFDVSAFLSAFSTEEPAGDFNDDGHFNFFDVSAFLSAFSAGCP